MIRSGTSVAANYRAACMAKSPADFINKMAIVQEETDETCLWMEILDKSGIMDKKNFEELYKEAEEILAITIASVKTARKNKGRK